MVLQQISQLTLTFCFSAQKLGLEIPSPRRHEDAGCLTVPISCESSLERPSRRPAQEVKRPSKSLLRFHLRPHSSSARWDQIRPEFHSAGMLSVTGRHDAHRPRRPLESRDDRTRRSPASAGRSGCGTSVPPPSCRRRRRPSCPAVLWPGT